MVASATSDLSFVHASKVLLGLCHTHPFKWTLVCFIRLLPHVLEVVIEIICLQAWKYLPLQQKPANLTIDCKIHVPLLHEDNAVWE